MNLSEEHLVVTAVDSQNNNKHLSLIKKNQKYLPLVSVN